MSDYTPITDFSAKDALTTGDPEKIILGSDVDAEFDAINTAIQSKYDSGDLASQAQAQAGALNTVLMTPLRVKDFIQAANYLKDIYALVDPNADRILFWDDSAGAVAQLAPDGTSISISGTTISTGSNVPLLNAANTFTNTNIFSGASAPFVAVRSTAAAQMAYTRYDINSTAKGYIGVAGTTNDLVTGSSANDLVLRSEGGNIRFSQNSGSSSPMVLATSTGSLALSGTAPGLTLTGTNQYIQITDTVQCYMQAAGNTDFRIGTLTNHPISFYPNGAQVLQIASSGAITPLTSIANSFGYLGVPVNSQAGNYTLVASDAGKCIDETTGGSTVTIPANASVAFPVGTIINVVARVAATISIAITSDTLYLSGSNFGTTGTRTLAGGGQCSLRKISTTGWLISGDVS